MTQRLIVKRDRSILDRNAERARDIQRGGALRQLPQATEQAVGYTPTEDDVAAIAHPQRIAREHAQLVRFLPARGAR